MKNKALVLSTGLAMFSMFFGSGNLVFPLVVGKLSESHYILATLGILITGVIVPFLGILGMFLFQGNANEFFARLGKPAIFWFSLFALAIMGPFGVLARCITVSHGAYRLIQPTAPLWLFSIIFCIILFLLTTKKNKIVPVLGTILTPFLLASLAAIAISGLLSNNLPQAASSLSSAPAWNSFKEGIFQGYQTMDLLAAFFFSSFVISHLKKNSPETDDKKTSSLPIFFKSALIGAGLLSIIYCILVLLGSMYAPQLGSVPPQELLAFIAQAALGSYAAPIVCSAVILACLTTAIVLASLFADFLRKEVAQNKISSSLSLVTTLIIAFCISTLEFAGISKYIGPILATIYPALIVLTLMNIFYKIWGWKTIRMPIAAALIVKLLTAL